MKNRKNLIMENIERISELFGMLCNSHTDSPLGKKVAQKVFYFFERKGINLNLRYGIHFFGPYSARLDNTMHILESEDRLSIDTSHATHVITLDADTVTSGVLSPEEKKIADFVLEKFSHKTAFELEALATMDFVANTMLCTNKKDEIISKFIEIKGDKFNTSTIEKTYKTLVTMELIAA